MRFGSQTLQPCRFDAKCELHSHLWRRARLTGAFAGGNIVTAGGGVFTIDATHVIVVLDGLGDNIDIAIAAGATSTAAISGTRRDQTREALFHSPARGGADRREAEELRFHPRGPLRRP
jgi:hypothetical protein